MTRPKLHAHTITLILTIPLCIALGASAADPAQPRADNSSTSLGGRLQHSAIVLMPEGTKGPLETMLPLRPTVVAWGNDAVGMLNRPDELKRRTDAYHQLGIKLLACNVWMLTATDRVLYTRPEYQAAVCVDIAGDKIVPPWLDSDYKGVKPYWGCTNHPLFRQQVRSRAKANEPQSPLVIHLLNQDYNADTDKMRPAEGLTVQVGKALLGDSGPGTAEFFAPGAQPVPLTTRNQAGDLVLNVPRLDLWGIIRITEVAPPSVAPHAVR